MINQSSIVINQVEKKSFDSLRCVETKLHYKIKNKKKSAAVASVKWLLQSVFTSEPQTLCTRVVTVCSIISVASY